MTAVSPEGKEPRINATRRQTEPVGGFYDDKLIATIYTAVDDVEADVAELLLKLESSRKIAVK